MNELLKRYKEWGYPQREKIRVKRSLRVNSKRISNADAVKKLEKQRVKLDKVKFLSHGYDYTCRFPLASSLENLLGYIYIQEAPAQIPGEIIKEITDEKSVVLDMAAAPGGKTTQISEFVKKVVAIDNKKDRVKKLEFNLERMHVTNCDVYIEDALNFESKEKFDVVLLDAPCSGNFTQGKNWLQKRKLADFKNRQKLQRKLLEKAKTLVKKGGYIIYSTCSLEVEENEEVVEYGLFELGLKLEKSKIKIGSPGLTAATKDCIRIWPTETGYPGFFVAKMKLE